MLENEIQDANEEQTTTSESVDESQVEGESQQTKTEVESKEAKEEASTPFHEHPRFKELVQQKNEALAQTKQFEAALNEMRQQLEGFKKTSSSTSQQAQDALIERLKGIDPEFAKRIEELSSIKPELNELREWKAKADAESFQNRVKQEISALHTEFKVSDRLKAKYENEIKAIAQANPNLGLQDLKTVYKQVHEDYQALLEEIKREERKQYVDSKKKDASIPKSPSKGAVPPKSTPKKAETLDREEMKRDIVKSALEKNRAAQDI